MLVPVLYSHNSDSFQLQGITLDDKSVAAVGAESHSFEFLQMSVTAG